MKTSRTMLTFKAVSIALFALIAGLIDLFGLASDSAKFSTDFAHYVSSPIYGGGSGRRPGQDRITVVYLDEAGLDTLHEIEAWRYPPTFDAYAQLLQDVATGAGADIHGDLRPGPRAIFVDFTFLSRGRNEDEERGFSRFVTALAAITRATDWNDKAACLNDEIAKLACMRAAGGVPVILGGSKSAPMTVTRNAKDDLLHVAAMASVQVDERLYPLLGRPQHPEDSPAALLLVAECLADSRGCQPQGAFEGAAQAAERLIGQGDLGAGGFLSTAAEVVRGPGSGPFAVRWSSRQALGATGENALHKALYGRASPCLGAANPEGSHRTFGEITRRVFTRLTPWRIGRADANEPGRNEVNCPYTLSLSYANFITGPSVGPALRERLFSDRLVLVGGQYKASNDWIPTPVHGLAAGVQYHAMALDNLLERRADNHAAAPINGRTPIWASFATAGLIFFMVLLSGVYRQLLRRQRKRWMPSVRSAVMFLGLYLAFLLTDLAIVWLAAHACVHFDIPLNWAACLVIVLGHGLWTMRKEILVDFRPLLEALARQPWREMFGHDEQPPRGEEPPKSSQKSSQSETAP